MLNSLFAVATRGRTPWLPAAATRWTKGLRLGALLGCLAIVSFGLAASSARAAPTTTVALGQASSYAALARDSVGNTVSGVGAPHTTLRGDLGVNASAQPTGFPPGVVTGVTRVGPMAGQAYNDAVGAYNEVAARLGGAPLVADLIGATISPGLYKSLGAVANTGTVTLDGGGDPNAIFVLQVNGALAMAAGSHVVLTGGAQASHVFWQVTGAATIGATGATFAGTLMAPTVAVGNGSLVNGRAFALGGALTLDDDQFYSAPPALAITGGATAETADTTPTMSGTTDVEAPALVTVTVGNQTLTATPSAGAWSVTSGLLSNATYPVAASTTDAAGNVTTVGQQLTVDTVPPDITLDGGASVLTADPTPTIAGASDVAPGTIVQVTVDSRTLTALVQSDHSWNVTPSALTDGSHSVTATVSDPAGNQTTAGQALTVDTTAPAVTVSGGATALTNDATPQISGTANGAAGSTATVTLADQTLAGIVGSDGSWSVTAAALSDGPHRVMMSVSDAAGNSASFTQTLTVDTVSPVLTITGGPSVTTNDLARTITGTSDAAPGTTVTVSVADQTMTTLLQSNGTWNVTPTSIGEGSWQVVASASDPAGNVGTARQSLTIAALAPPAPVSTGAPSGAGSPAATAPPAPSSTGGTSGTGSPAATAPPASINTSGTDAPGAANRLTMRISCPSGGRCRGSLSASSRVTSRGGKPVLVTPALAQAGSQRGPITATVLVASGSYSVAGGGRAAITLALNRRGRELLNRFYRVPATLKITGTISARRTITFSYLRVRAGISASWVVSKSATSVSSLTVSRLTARSTVTVRCHGGGCPFAIRSFPPETRSLALAPGFGNAKLKPGATVQITVSAAGQIATVAGFAVRRGRAPAQTSLCLVPGARKPSACAAG